MKNKILLAFALAIALVGCRSTEVKPVPPEDFVIVHPDRAPALNLERVEWEVWNRDRIVVEGAKEENRDKVFYILTPDQASKLFSNLIDISDYISKSVENNTFYKTSIDDYRKSKIEADAAKDK